MEEEITSKGNLEKYFKKIASTWKTKYKNQDGDFNDLNNAIVESLSAWEFTESWSDLGKIDTNSNIPELICNMKSKEEFRLLELDEKVLPLIKTTDNKIFYRHSPLNCFFINHKFKLFDHTVLGIFVFDYGIFSNEVRTSYGINEDLGILFLSHKEGDNEEYFHYFYLENPHLAKDKLREQCSPEEYKKVEKMRQIVKTYVCNLIDFMTEEKDYEMTNHPKDNIRNMKRIKRGKSPIPHRVYIKLTGKLKLRAEAFESGMKKYSHKFLVRGFWRHFRSSRYVNVQGKKIWVYPFWKGQGECVTKSYKVKQ